MGSVCPSAICLSVRLSVLSCLNRLTYENHHDTWNTVQDLRVFVSNLETFAIKSCMQSRASISRVAGILIELYQILMCVEIPLCKKKSLRPLRYKRALHFYVTPLTCAGNLANLRGSGSLLKLSIQYQFAHSDLVRF